MALPVEHMAERKRHAPIVPLSRYPLVTVYDGLLYSVHRVTRDNRGELRRRALPFEEEFGYSDSFLTHDKVRHYIREGGEVVFTKTTDRDQRDVALVTQEMRRVVIGGQERNILSIGIRVVLEPYQKHGVARHQLREAVTRLHPDAITGQFRTWRIARLYQETDLISELAPIDGPMTDEMQEALGAILDKSTLRVTNLRTGVAMGIFPPGESRRFIPSPTNEKAVEVDRRIRALGAIPERGDAIRYYATVDQEAVDASYLPPEVSEYGRLRAIVRSVIRLMATVVKPPLSR